MRMHVILVALTIGAAGQAHAQEAQGDPFEKFNRAVFSFNTVVDRYTLEPLAKGYRAITNEPIREGVGNVLSNLSAPVTFANDVLQAAPKRAGTTVARFGINSTLGVVGIFDVASKFGLEKHTEDFGQTLGRWGVGPGPYLILPLLGPSNVRDAVGSVVDVGLDPINYAEFDGDDAFRTSRAVIGAIHAREGAIDGLSSIYDTSIDPYVSIRTTYSILRESAVKNGQTNIQDLPEFEEITPEPGTNPGAADSGVQAPPELPQAPPAQLSPPAPPSTPTP